MRLWLLDPADLGNLACHLAARNLTVGEWQQYFGDSPYHRTCPELPQDPLLTVGLLDKGAQLAQQGEIAGAIAAYAEAQQRDPQFFITGAYWNKLCRWGALWERVKDLQDACGRAVALEPNNADYRDSRGIARTLVGDPTGAIDDFTAYSAWLKAQDPEGNKDKIAQREAWIAALQAGRNPFDKTTLEQLRVESYEL